MQKSFQKYFRTGISAAAFAALLGSTALAQPPAPTPTAPTPTAPTPTAPAATPAQRMAPPAPAATAAAPGPADLSPADKLFVQKAAQGGIAEVQMAQLAQQQGVSDEVKQFAQKMVDDHTPNNEQLVKLATAKGLTPPTEPNALQQRMLTHLQGLQGQKFDHAYIGGQIKAHTAMLKLFKKEAASGQDPDIKAFAEKTVPVIEDHLTMAQGLTKAGS